MISVDTDTLESIISALEDLSMDGRVAPDQQKQFLGLAKRLRGMLVSLLSAQFNEGTQSVLDANSALTAVNAQVQAATNGLAAAANAISKVTSIAGQLDSLLKGAAKLV